MPAKIKRARSGVSVKIPGKIAVFVLKSAMDNGRTFAQEVNWALSTYLNNAVKPQLTKLRSSHE